MKDFKIKRGISTLLYNFFPLLGAWFVILFMTNKSELYIYSGLLGSLIVITIFSLMWVKLMAFTRDEIVLHRLIGNKSLMKKEIESVGYKGNVYRLKMKSGKVIQIPVFYLSKKDRDKIEHYFKDIV